MTRCGDPYGVGCRAEATSSTLCHDRHSDEPAVLDLCGDCCWWNADWDWENEPTGPAAP